MAQTGGVQGYYSSSIEQSELSGCRGRPPPSARLCSRPHGGIDDTAYRRSLINTARVTLLHHLWDVTVKPRRQPNHISKTVAVYSGKGPVDRDRTSHKRDDSSIPARLAQLRMAQPGSVPRLRATPVPTAPAYPAGCCRARDCLRAPPRLEWIQPDRPRVSEFSVSIDSKE